MKALTATDFHFDGQKSVYHGKVRDVYDINDDILVMIATDRISAFDVILPKGIPYKGQVLNQIASKFLDATADICPNWKLATPDPMVTVGLKCEGFRVEMIIRSILTGSAWRAYVPAETIYHHSLICCILLQDFNMIEFTLIILEVFGVCTSDKFVQCIS